MTPLLCYEKWLETFGVRFVKDWFLKDLRGAIEEGENSNSKV